MKAKILIVDDHTENIRALSELIESDDVEIYSATTANQALELVTQHDFSVGLFDVQMPETTGFELARLIRGVSHYKRLPIIFVTAHSETDSLILEGYETGAVDLLFKPLQAQVVRSKVRVFVELDQQQRLLREKLDEVERLKLAAEAANIAKGHFLANMSHEIRTPLAAVMGFSEMIAKDKLSENEKVEFVSAVKRNGKLLLRLIDDILDFSKIESGHLDMEKIEFDLREILNDVDSSLSLKAQQKGLLLKFNMSYLEGLRFLGDPTRIKQVLLNVIGNAIKFTSKGVVTVMTQSEGLNEKSLSRISIYVKDQGIGLTQGQVARLFKPFAQADVSTTRRFGGSGLGLTISKRIANQMGGEVELLESEPAKGSTFKITFVLEAVQPQPNVKSRNDLDGRQMPESVDLSGFKILVVDDLPDNLVLINFFLRVTHIHLVLVESGEEAIKRVAEEPFDLILMDIQMPGLDGYDAVKSIRKNGFTRPIIAVTAHVLNSVRDKCLQSGCNDVLPKPVTRESLLRVLKKYLPFYSSSSSADPKAARYSGRA